jgi:toxin ParE1/3/4
MAQLLKRPQAETDLEEIWWYIAQNNPKNADNFLDFILKQCLFLAQSPYSGKKRDELLQGLRSFPVRNYVIFYFPLENGVEIVRVMHGSRDIDKIVF